MPFLAICSLSTLVKMHQRPDYVHIDHILETNNTSLEGCLLYNGKNISINITLDQLLIYLDDSIGKLSRRSWLLKTGIVIFVLKNTPFPFHSSINMLISAQT